MSCHADHTDHNKIVDDFINLCNKNLTEKIISKCLSKYNIDINYDNSMLLNFASTSMGDSTEDPNYSNIKLLLEMGADPKLMVREDIISCETHPINQIRLDAIFKLYGHICKWDHDIDFNKFGDRLLRSDEEII